MTFVCHLPGAGVCESERWRPPTATVPHSANPALSGRTETHGRTGTSTNVESQTEDAIDPNGLTVKAERPDEVKQAERQEEQLKAMQMEDEEDPWSGLGMDEAGEILPGKSTNVESQAEDAANPQEEPNKLQDQRVDVDEDSHRKLMQSVLFLFWE